MILSVNELLAVKAEATYGTDAFGATPPAAWLAPVRDSVTVRPIIAEVVDNGVFGVHATRESQFYGDFTELSFQIPLTAMGGAAGTAPEYGPILLGCGLVPTVVADTSVTYDPAVEGLNDPSNTSFTLKYYEFNDIEQNECYIHTIRGCRGNFELTLAPGGVAMLTFTGQGLFSPPPTSDAATPTLPSAYQSAAAKNFIVVQGVSMKLGDDTAFFSAMSINHQMQVAQSRFGNGAAAVDEIYLHRSGNSPTATLTLKSDRNAIEKWAGLLATGAKYALECVLNDGTGRVTIGAPACQPTAATVNRAEGRKVVELATKLHGNFGTTNGADYLKLKFDAVPAP